MEDEKVLSTVNGLNGTKNVFPEGIQKRSDRQNMNLSYSSLVSEFSLKKTRGMAKNNPARSET